MSGVWTILLGNAIPAAILAVLAFLVSRTFRRPALTHLLWILVLLKLVTPPILPWSIAVSEETAAAIGLAPSSNSGIVARNRSQQSVISSSPTRTTGSPIAAGEESRTGSPARSAVWEETAILANSAQQQSSTGVWRWLGHNTPAVLVTIWIAGSLVTTLCLARMLLWIRRQFRSAYAIDDVSQARVDELATRLGLKAAPRIRIVNGIVSPLLWGVGPHTTIVFPRTLWEELPECSRDALLLHELAHYRRGDQWVRLLEMVVVCLYWWHPCVWWARRELSAAEEECCDAWVVRHAGHQPRSYAEAIITTLDYLAGEQVHRTAVATGVNSMPVLRRRLTHIMKKAVSPVLPRPVVWGIVSTGSVILCLQPLPYVVPNFATAVTSSESPPANLFQQLTDHGEEFVSGGPASVDVQREPIQGWWSPRESSPLTVVFSPDRRFMVERRGADNLRVVDRTREVQHDLSEAGITCLVFLPTGNRFIAGSEDGAVRVWDAEDGRPVSALGFMDGRVTSIDISADGRRVISGGQSGSIMEWETASGSSTNEWTSPGGLPVVCVRMGDDGRILASVGHWHRPQEGQLVVLNRKTFELVESLPVGQIIAAIEIDSAGDGLVLLTDYAGQVWAWSSVDFSLTSIGHVARDDVATAAFSPAFRLSARL